LSDLTKLTAEDTNRILDLVGELQPCTAPQVLAELQKRFGVEAELPQLVRYMEFLRSNFPRKLVHAGPDGWGMVDLS
jgi:hypothetical protein